MIQAASTKDSIGTVSVHFSSDGSIATILLGDPIERFVTFDEPRMSSLRAALLQVRDSKAKGLVLRSPSPESFCVGADISLIQSVTDSDTGARLAREGQEVFNILEDLSCITVAAIGGPCVGGGCELVLACDFRIATNSKATSIGLPETKLGIFPGFGGTYRLPRLIGLPKALDIILAGKTLRAPQALKAGLVDEVIAPGDLYARAEEIARGGRPPRRRKTSVTDRLLTNNAIGRAIVAYSARKTILKQTKGFYPAQPKALTVTVAGLGKDRSRALLTESQEAGALMVTPESKALVHLFFLTEASKSIGKGARKDIENMHAVVVGAGTMGAGIAGTLARGGHQVIVKDTSDASLQRGKDHIVKELSKLRYLSSFERAAALNRIDWIQFSSPTISRAGVVIEAVFEDMQLKKKIFSGLSQQVSSECVLATNTSSLSVTEMATAIKNPERFVGMHFFNPVEKMPLVEIIRGKETSDATVAKVAALATEMGKFPIVVNDVPGFLINRILIPYLNEAVYLLADGHSVIDIDEAALRFGMPMGPIRLLDEVGLDVAAHVSQIMVDGYGERMAVPPFAEKLMRLERKGRKNGRGFYEYQGKDASPWTGLAHALDLPRTPRKKLSQAEITERLIFHLVNEAMKCLEQGVAGSDADLARKQIDLGTVMGIGFPPFRGGVLHFAEKKGLQEIRDRLCAFHSEFGVRYEPF